MKIYRQKRPGGKQHPHPFPFPTTFPICPDLPCPTRCQGRGAVHGCACTPAPSPAILSPALPPFASLTALSRCLGKRVAAWHLPVFVPAVFAHAAALYLLLSTRISTLPPAACAAGVSISRDRAWAWRTASGVLAGVPFCVIMVSSWRAGIFCRNGRRAAHNPLSARVATVGAVY